MRSPVVVYGWSIGITALLVCAGCALGASLPLTFPGAGTAILFPSYAIVTVALLRTRARWWWVVLVAGAVGNFAPHLHREASVSFVVMAEATNVVRAVLAAVALRSLADGRFDTARGLVVYLVFAVVLAPCVAAFGGVATVAVHRDGVEFWIVWQAWALSNVITALTLLPLLALRGVRLDRRRVVEAALLFGGLLVVATLVFTRAGGNAIHPTHLYWPMPFLLWAAVRFGLHGTSAAVLAVMGFSICGAVAEIGPFAGGQPDENLLELQLWLLIITIPLMSLTVVIREREQTRRQAEAQRSAAEALRDADRRKDEFLATLGHELRGPLTAIALGVEVQKTLPDTEEARWAEAAIDRQLAQVTRLVDDLLDVARVAHGKIELAREPVDLREIVRTSVETAQRLDARHEIDVVLPGEPVVVEGDPVRLAQVVGNLLANALKYAGGYICVAVELEDDTALIVVTDDGDGIPTEALPTVFELFAQGRQARGGLGIGLALVKRLVELHGGTIEATSSVGTSMTVRLPASWSEITPRPRPLAQVTGESLRVLVVDDDGDIAMGLASILGSWRHEVRIVHDGFAALETLGAFDPDVVLLDIGLPQVSGVEVARRMRERSERTLIISMSGYDRARLAGENLTPFRHHLLKPLDVDLLRSILDGARR